VEIHDRCFSKQKCNCGRLKVTVAVFVGVKRESGTPVLHLSLIAPLTLLAIIKPCILHSTTSVSDCWGAFVSAMLVSHTTPSIAV